MHSEDLRTLTPLIYSHVTPYGTFRLDINLSHLWSGRAATVMAQYFTQVGNLGAFVSAHPHLNLTQWALTPRVEKDGLETFRKDFGTRDADLLPPCLSRFTRLSLPFRYLFFPRLTGWLRMVHFPFRGCLRSLCVSFSQANDF
jgi:hypothetical protein